METFLRLFGGLLSLVYHCFDRIVIFGYLPLLSRRAAKPLLSDRRARFARPSRLLLRWPLAEPPVRASAPPAPLGRSHVPVEPS